MQWVIGVSLIIEPIDNVVNWLMQAICPNFPQFLPSSGAASIDNSPTPHIPRDQARLHGNIPAKNRQASSSFSHLQKPSKTAGRYFTANSSIMLSNISSSKGIWSAVVYG